VLVLLGRPEELITAEERLLRVRDRKVTPPK
jgi:hypothetical protein